MSPSRKIRSSEAPAWAHLNSVWMDGVVVAAAPPLPATLRHFHVEFPVPEGSSRILVQAPEAAAKVLPLQGARVRVLGRLKQHHWNDAAGRPHAEVAIWGELIEAGP